MKKILIVLASVAFLAGTPGVFAMTSEEGSTGEEISKKNKGIFSLRNDLKKPIWMILLNGTNQLIPPSDETSQKINPGEKVNTAFDKSKNTVLSISRIASQPSNFMEFQYKFTPNKDILVSFIDSPYDRPEDMLLPMAGKYKGALPWIKETRSGLSLRNNVTIDDINPAINPKVLMRAAEKEGKLAEQDRIEREEERAEQEEKDLEKQRGIRQRISW